MSFGIFTIQKNILEIEIEKYRQFLSENFKIQDIRAPNMEMLNDYKDTFHARMSENPVKFSFDDQVKYFLVAGWKSMFKIDNLIDKDKPIKEQKEILEHTLNSIKTSGKIDTTYFSGEDVDIINTNFLTDENKVYILIELLESEIKLCNENIPLTDALFNRLRIIYYSLLFVFNKDKLEVFVNTFNNPEKRRYLPKLILEILKVGNITETDVENILGLSFLEDFKKYIDGWDMSMIDVFKFFILSSGIICLSDDYMDIKEDISNNKITGITQCIKTGIDPRTLTSATILYMFVHLEKMDVPPKTTELFKELVHFAYNDEKEFLKYFKEISPELFTYLCQRIHLE